MNSISQPKYAATGHASYYAAKFDGRKTANGEIFSNKKLTAAHRTLPFGTIVKVTNVKNNKSVVVRINDRGPYAKNRIIDLSHAAADSLGIIHAGFDRNQFGRDNETFILKGEDYFGYLNADTYVEGAGKVKYLKK